jgi:hypothetical protein
MLLVITSKSGCPYQVLAWYSKCHIVSAALNVNAEAEGQRLEVWPGFLRGTLGLLAGIGAFAIPGLFNAADPIIVCPCEPRELGR